MTIKEAFAQAEEYRAEAPTPLTRAIPDPEPMPRDALGPLTGAAEAIEEQVRVPYEIAAQSVLAVASLAAQAHRNVTTLGGERPISLYCMTIARSGERKSTCDRLAMEAVTAFERELAGDHREQRERYENDQALYQAAKSNVVKAAKSDRDGARADLDALGPAPQPPLSPWLTSTDPTFEGLTRALEHGRPALGLFTDEGGQFLGGHAMNPDNRLKTIAGLSRFWDGAPINRTRAGDGSSTYYGRRLSAHLLVQPLAAETLLADPMARDQGILSRCLIAHPKSTIGQRTIAETVADVATVAAGLSKFHGRIDSLLRRPLPLKPESRNELDPPALALSADARRLLVRFANAVEREQAEGGRLEHVTGFASKVAEHAARLAGVLTTYADPEAREISPDLMACGIALGDWYLAEAVRLRDSAAISQETTQAEALRQWLVSSWPEPFVSARAIVQFGPNSLRETKAVRRLIPMLVANGWLVLVPNGAPVGGSKAREAWRVVRG